MGHRAEQMRILLVTYEFTYAPFSGNGMLSRSIAKSLLSLGCSLRVICCRPADMPGLAADNHLDDQEVPVESLELWPVDLPESAGWRRLNDKSGWQEYWVGAAMLGPQAVEWAPEAVIAVDWTGAGAWRGMKAAWTNGGAPPLCYVNFRVYSSGVPPEAAAWYDEKEKDALAEANLVVALSPADQKSLTTLLVEHFASAKTSALLSRIQSRPPPPVKILMPPLRADVQALAQPAVLPFPAVMEVGSTPQGVSPPKAKAISFRSKARREKAAAAAAAEAANVEQAKEAAAAAVAAAAPKPDLPAEFWAAVGTAGPTRRFVTCAVRLSREKNPMGFVHMVEGALQALRANGLVPLLCGAAAEAEYAEAVKVRLREVAPEAVIIEEFLAPPALAVVFSATALNVHPCPYDAFGMTLVEAAAFGAPSLLNGGGTVGAAQLLPPRDDASFECRFDSATPQELAARLSSLLSNTTKLEAVGSMARFRALRWTERAYGQSLLVFLRSLRAAGHPGARVEL